MDIREIDQIAILKSIDEARLSKHEDSRPHPLVGAVILKDNKIIESAHRGELGLGEHAEYTLLEKKLKDEIIAGSTIFTTLEPCTNRNHPKVPCVDRLIERKVKTVWIGMVDPDERITGKGIEKLRAANIEVILYPKEYGAILEEINREFTRDKKKKQLKESISQDILDRLASKSLDDWYVTLNKIYWNRNYYKDTTLIFSHLVEVVGGLSLLASEKVKVSIKPEEYLPKAIAWWIALCGKLGINSVEEMLWDKFPNECPYCHRKPHNDRVCKEKKIDSKGPDWEYLKSKKNAYPKPTKIKDWQLMFEGIYPTNEPYDFKPVFARLVEELGELAEAIRIFPAEPGYFLSEASDVFAWLMKIQNIIDAKNNLEIGNLLTKGLSINYPEVCIDCNSFNCSCPPILKSTIGRIAHEVPLSKYSLNSLDRFLTADQTSEKFGNF